MESLCRALDEEAALHNAVREDYKKKMFEHLELNGKEQEAMADKILEEFTRAPHDVHPLDVWKGLYDKVDDKTREALDAIEDQIKTLPSFVMPKSNEGE